VEEARLVHSALGHQEMEVGMKINPVAKCLNSRDDTGLEIVSRYGPEIEKNRSDSTAAKFPEKLALEFEEYPKHLRDREDDLAVRNIKEERLAHPLTPLLQSFGVARRTEAARLTGKRQQMFRPAAWAADPGESAAGIAAVEVFFDHLFDDRTEEAIFALKTLIIFRDKPLEMMKKHPIEDRAFRMTSTVDSPHIGNKDSKNAPRTRSRADSRDSAKKTQEMRSEKRRNPSTIVALLNKSVYIVLPG